MSSTIRLLDETTVNKIAAGEVIENPASVVKELIDNAIDAKASEIIVEVKAGGRQLIRVTDNGNGMSHDDAILSLERHATSKIRAIDDLNEVGTMGFRGEAIPSIASISKFTLLTSLEGHEGTLVVVEGGRILKHCEAARARGTTIEVKSLFFNVPVRKKFQRSTAADLTEIQHALGKLALAHPEISFQLISNQKSLLRCRGTTMEEFGVRVSDVMGRDFFSGLKEMNVQHGALNLRGYLGQPTFTRHNRTGQSLILNRRPVQCPLVSYGIVDGYGTRLPPRRHPVYVLHLELPPEWIDVNVHPQKREVRLRQGGEIRRFISDSVASLWAPHRPTPTQQAAASAHKFTPTSTWEPLATPPIDRKVSPTLIQEVFVPEKPKHSCLGVVGDTLLVDRLDGHLVLVDCPAAQARIRYETFCDRLCDEESAPIESQALLVPVTLNLSSFEASRLRDHLVEINALGLQIEDFGQDNFAINGIPSFLQEGTLEAFVAELVRALDSCADKKQLREERNKRLALAASQAVRGGPKLTLVQASALYRSLLECKEPHHSPDGHPTMTVLSSANLKSIIEKGAPCKID